MERKNYSEYLAPRLIKSTFVHCLLGVILILLIYVIITSITCLIMSDYDYISDLKRDILLIVGIYYLFIIRPRLSRALIHDNGDLEILFYNNFYRQNIAIKDIMRVHFQRNSSIIYGETIEIQLYLIDGSRPKLCVKDIEPFLKELKKHNKKIHIPEIPPL